MHESLSCYKLALAAVVLIGTNLRVDDTAVAMKRRKTTQHKERTGIKTLIGCKKAMAPSQNTRLTISNSKRDLGDAYHISQAD